MQASSSTFDTSPGGESRASHDGIEPVLQPAPPGFAGAHDAPSVPFAPGEKPSIHSFQDAQSHGAGTGAGVSKPGPGRKPRACLECKRQKMKCEVPAGSRKCKHCLRRNIDCSLRFTKPALPSRYDGAAAPAERTAAVADAYESKIDSMRGELEQLRAALDTLVERGAFISSNGGGPSKRGSMQYEQTGTPQSTTGLTILSEASVREDNTHMAMTRENSLEPDQAGSGEQSLNGAVTVEEPMSSLYEVTRLRNIRSNQAQAVRSVPAGETEINDFITRGVISEKEAQELYITFHTSLNHYLWVGLEQIHASLTSVRRSSELLTATILAVTALHIPTSAETFDKCYKEFLTLISSSMFSRYHSIDDVRALCIAAFWLSEVSWKLSGHAIRIATELGIHQSFHKALSGDREHFLRARLWYMLYVCDHHFSIVYGRPPMTAESLQIREHELFLQIPLADALDKRILSQVSIMQILTRIHDRFVEQRLPQPTGAVLNEGDFVDMRNFNLEIDQWRMRWQPRQEMNHFIGTFPPKGNQLYSYFAKLQLNSLAVRGVNISPGQLSTERKEFANHAISAAASILTFVLEEEDMRRSLVGSPLYVHTMIAFASVFLMKVTTKWNRIIGLNVEARYVSELLERMIALLKSSITSERHLLHHIAAGLEKMLAKSQAASPGLWKPAASNSQGEMVTLQSNQFSASGSMDQYGYVNGAMGANNAGMPSDFASDLAPWESSFSDTMSQSDFNDMTILNDGWIHEAFGQDSGNGVYNLLTSQFSY